MAEDNRRLPPNDSPTHGGGVRPVHPSGTADAGVSNNASSPAADADHGPDSPTLAEAYGQATARTPVPPRLFGEQPMLQSGTVLAGRYEILEMLGEGGMGAVYKARDRELTRTVALKVIRPDLVRDPAIVERFKQELRLSHQVTHKNVIRIYDLGEGEGVKFITMEYIEGKDLRALIRE